MQLYRRKSGFLVVILVLAITANPCDCMSVNKLSAIRHNAFNGSNYETSVLGNFRNGHRCDAKEILPCIEKISGKT